MKYSKEACEDWLDVGDMVLVTSDGFYGAYQQLAFVVRIDNHALVIAGYKNKTELRSADEYDLGIGAGMYKGWDRIKDIQLLSTIDTRSIKG